MDTKNTFVANTPPKAIRRIHSPIIADDNRAAQIGEALKSILAALVATGAPYVAPAVIGPLLGITDAGFRYYCRECRSARNWQTNYRFFLDDPEHVKVLSDILRLALWSMKRAPKHLKSKAH